MHVWLAVRSGTATCSGTSVDTVHLHLVQPGLQKLQAAGVSLELGVAERALSVLSTGHWALERVLEYCAGIRKGLKQFQTAQAGPACPARHSGPSVPAFLSGYPDFGFMLCLFFLCRCQTTLLIVVLIPVSWD